MKNPLLPILFFIFFGALSSVIQANPQYLLAKNDQGINNAAQSIKQETGGRILSTKTVNKNGRIVYKIKVLLPSGKVQTFNVNAK